MCLYRCSTVPHVDLLTMDKSVALSGFLNNAVNETLIEVIFTYLVVMFVKVKICC